MLAGCADDVPTAPPEGDDEIAILHKLVVIESAQVLAYRAAADAAGRGDEAARWTAQAAVEQAHVDALGTLLHRLGSALPRVAAGTADPGIDPAARLMTLARLEARAAAAWRYALPRTTQDIVRVGCVSIAAVEIRQATALAIALGRPVPVTAPPPRPLDAVVSAVRDLARIA